MMYIYKFCPHCDKRLRISIPQIIIEDEEKENKEK